MQTYRVGVRVRVRVRVIVEVSRIACGLQLRSAAHGLLIVASVFIGQHLYPHLARTGYHLAPCSLSISTRYMQKNRVGVRVRVGASGKVLYLYRSGVPLLTLVQATP